ncbi:MAG: pseudouridine synthase [Calothrix sp. MO_192.B10]|nr:pseudouridine synthase [Calothrix sp. MO_192.B10]
MTALHSLSDFIHPNSPIPNSRPSYYYQGYCPQTGELLKLPRTPLAEAIAHGLMAQLAQDELYSYEGKMYGILLIELSNGEQKILKAFSGLLNGCSVVDGWVPPIPGREEVALAEARTLAELETIKQELINLKQIPERQECEKLEQEFVARLQQMSQNHSDRKQQRQVKRQIFTETLTREALDTAIAQLDQESRQDGIARKLLKRERNQVLQPLKQIIEDADVQIRELKRKRKEISRQLQAQMHAAYSLMNFYGRSQTLQQLIPQGLPTGTGDCCAPKLLHYAATHNLKPLAMAEFWWGASSKDKIQGNFYGACVERCQPLMGFLLSGLQSNLPVTQNEGAESAESAGENKGTRERNKFHPITSSRLHSFQVSPPRSNPTTNHENASSPLPTPKLLTINCQLSTSNYFQIKGEVPIIYEDEWLIAVNKPSGLLSVPGRYLNNQDSVLSRLHNLLPDGANLRTVHRLDMDTSGILLLARDYQTHSLLNQQFQQRQIYKVYEAVLAGCIYIDKGVIQLPLWGDPKNRPYQQVNWQYGKQCITNFRVIGTEGNRTRVEFIPITGRTHQLRVHAAHPKGLGMPILGDRLYGNLISTDRLHLHARELCLQHPYIDKKLHLQTNTPF